MGVTHQTPLTTTAMSGGAGDQTEQLVARARELGPIIREHADEAESERRLATPVHEALRAAGLQRMLAPRSLG